MLLSDAYLQLLEIARALGRWARAFGLKLKARKCVFLPVWESADYASLQAPVVTGLPDISEVEIGVDIKK